MQNSKKKIILGITGASGAIYAKQIMDQLLLHQQQWDKVAIVMSDNAKEVWTYELGQSEYHNYPFDYYAKNDFYAPFASGSARYDTMIIAPCSMGTLARIAQGVSNDLISRAADVILKERRKLILVARDTPLSLIHLRNMCSLTEAGAIICPAAPSYYSLPQNIEELAKTVVDRVLDLAGLSINTYRWKENEEQ